MKTQKATCPVRIELAKSDAQRIQGLSGRASLADDRGMMFQFDQISKECMWMKDMNFSIDILWLGADSSILKIEHSLSPATYPASFCAENTYQVVELSSGSANRLGLHLGDKITLPVID